MRGRHPIPPLLRFWDYVSPEPNSGCWLWTGSLDAKGYGSFWGVGAHLKAHRFWYEHLYGPVPLGLELDHKCRVRCCVNPDHLEAVTHLENMRRGDNHHRHKTHCRNGHPYDSVNTYAYRGERLCRECRRQSVRQHQMKRAEVRA